jgi:hypothetical protein
MPQDNEQGEIMKRIWITPLSWLPPLILLMAGCGSIKPAPAATPAIPPPTPTYTATPTFPLPEGAIIFEIDPTRKFAGHVTGQGETAIILANMSQGGESQWDPLVTALDKKKFTVITFNYLQPDYSGAPQGVITILGRLREVGYKRVVCMGASLGVSACGSIPLEPEMVGMVMIAGPNLGRPVTTTYPKLFIAAADDRWAKDTETACKAADEPKQLVLYKDTGMHGTDLFYSQHREQFIKVLVDFVNGLP